MSLVNRNWSSLPWNLICIVRPAHCTLILHSTGVSRQTHKGRVAKSWSAAALIKVSRRLHQPIQTGTCLVSLHVAS